MCGIAGFLDRNGSTNAPVGSVLLRMLSALGDRGPDSTGMALFGPPSQGMRLRVKLGETSDFNQRAEEVLARVRLAGVSVVESEVLGPYLRLSVGADADLETLMAAIETHQAGRPDGSHTDHDPDSVEIISAGRCLEIVKQVGSPAALENSYHVSRFQGSHGIGHTRLSTESRVDLSHSQPFWAHGVPDLAVVHNGHITNYHRLRRIYEQRGFRFYTENDSEIIGIYLRQRMARGDSLDEAMRASLRELDGSFCYLAAAPGVLAFAKDVFTLKPLVVAETDQWAAVATEEIALRRAFGDGFRAVEPRGGTVHLWERAEPARLAA